VFLKKKSAKLRARLLARSIAKGLFAAFWLKIGRRNHITGATTLFAGI
jgi:hypothetical protein